MFDVYLNDRRDLLVVRKRFPIPVAYASGRWRKTKKKVVSVSDEARHNLKIGGVLIIRIIFKLKLAHARAGGAADLARGGATAATIIWLAVQSRGYYMRRLRDLKKS